MRISDWSSDVCSSDLPRAKVVRRTVAEPYLAAFVELFKSPAYRCILCAIVIFFFMGYGALVFIVSLLTRLFDMDLQTAGATFGSIALFGAKIGRASCRERVCQYV